MKKRRHVPRKAVPDAAGSPPQPRDRVVRHMTTILATGATLLAAACDRPIIGDPPAPPLDCQSEPATWQYIDRAVSVMPFWLSTASGFVIFVQIDARGDREENDSVAFPYDPRAVGATVRDIVRARERLQFQLVPDDEVSSIDLVIPVDCSGRDDSLFLRLDVSGTPRNGEPVPWDVNER